MRKGVKWAIALLLVILFGMAVVPMVMGWFVMM